MDEIYNDLTYIRKIDGKWYAFAGDPQKYQVYSPELETLDVEEVEA